MLSKEYRIFAWLVILLWALIMVYLFGFDRPAAKKMDIDLSRLGNISGLASGSEEYLGVYFNDKKIGYLLNRTERSNGKTIIRHRSRLNLSVQGLKKSVSIDGSAELSEEMILKAFFFRLNVENQEFIVTGNVEGNRFNITSNLPGFQTLVIDNSTPVFLDINLNRYIARKRLFDTKRMSYRVFSLEGFSDETVNIQMLGTERIKIMNEEIFAYHLKKRYKNYVIDSWIDFNGKTLKESSDMGFVLIRELMGDSIEEYADLDIVSQFSILPDRAIPDIFSLSELRIRIVGAEASSSLDGGRQFLNGDLLIIRSEIADKRLEELKEVDRERYLASEPFIQVNNKEIMRLAREIVKDEKDDYKKLEMINEYLFANVKKRNIMGIPDAYSTLKSMEGDCNEHASLFVALARSIGLPARVAGGIAYLNGRFYYHAWVEVYVDGRWLSFDPTWGESPADIGHIRLVYGSMDKILEISRYINKIKVEVHGWK